MCMLDNEHLNRQDWCRVTCRFGAVRVLGVDSCHNIVIASVQRGENGCLAMEDTLVELKTSFPKLELFLSLGTAEGIPQTMGIAERETDVRLGDVVVGMPKAGQSALGYCHLSASTMSQGNCVPHRSISRRLPEIPDNALRILNVLIRASQTAKLDLRQTMRRLDRGMSFRRPHHHTDRLHMPDSACPYSQQACSCAENRPVRNHGNDELVFHGGQILCTPSSTELVDRDHLASAHPEALCLETRTANLLQDCQFFAIRGISQYHRTQATSEWDAYAVGAAAALARELVRRLPVSIAARGMTRGLRKTYLFETLEIASNARIYNTPDLEDERNVYLDEIGRDVWERMTLSGIAVYEQIYAECASADGYVNSKFFRLLSPPVVGARKLGRL